ncbi:ShlB/FhaC/HecB family hemolysin secretion/activation protein [Escherichia coli]|nr:ShlB/FhaC/HecB family hemolysin secretion/activation protein [Escherichia coli]EFJ9343277.1 ShlB/FhaC/HecB family hemolysin secretion/activation protein [Escherichia coli]
MSALLSPLSLQAADVRRSGDEAFIIQQQRQEALEQQLTPSAPDVRLSAPGSFAHKINFPVETPCFQIKQTELKGADALPHWLPLQKIANGAVGHCLGAKGINLLMSTLQNRLVDHGYVTTRVLAPSQDLKSGILRLVIVPGVVRHVRLTPDSDDYIQLYSSFPAHEGSLLDLRDIEQGLDLGNSRIQGQHTELNATSGNLSTQNAQLSADTLSARTAGQFSSNGGTINADTLQISTQSLSNRKGSLIQTGTGDFSLSLPGSVDNREGLLAANGAVRLDALSLDNRKGKVQAEQSPSLQKSPPTFLKPFVAGVCAALLAVSVAIPGWQFLTQPSPEEQHFTWGNGCKKQ